MLTKEDTEKFADWIIAQEKILMDQKHPIQEGLEDLTDKELLELLAA